MTINFFDENVESFKKKLGDKKTIEKILSFLPMKQRMCYLLFTYAKLDDSTIAKIFKIEPGTVRTHLSLARDRLKMILFCPARFRKNIKKETNNFNIPIHNEHMAICDICAKEVTINAPNISSSAFSKFVELQSALSQFLDLNAEKRISNMVASIRDDNLWTPIFYAVSDEDTLLVVQLLPASDVLNIDKLGKTILLWSVGNGNLEITEVILKYVQKNLDKNVLTQLLNHTYEKMDEKKKISVKKTALSLAKERGYSDIERLLTEYGAKK
jgi:ankyrin repeat protein